MIPLIPGLYPLWLTPRDQGSSPSLTCFHFSQISIFSLWAMFPCTCTTQALKSQVPATTSLFGVIWARGGAPVEVPGDLVLDWPGKKGMPGGVSVLLRCYVVISKSCSHLRQITYVTLADSSTCGTTLRKPLHSVVVQSASRPFFILLCILLDGKGEISWVVKFSLMILWYPTEVLAFVIRKARTLTVCS